MEQSEPKPPVQYVLVRKDLPVRIQMVNVGHACGEAIRVAPISKRTVIRMLHVESANELLAYHERIVGKGFHVGLVNEPDAPYLGAAMSLATEPLTERVSAMGKIVFHLKAVDLYEADACVALAEEAQNPLTEAMHWVKKLDDEQLKLFKCALEQVLMGSRTD